MPGRFGEQFERLPFDQAFLSTAISGTRHIALANPPHTTVHIYTDASGSGGAFLAGHYYGYWFWSDVERRLFRQLVSTSPGGSLGINVFEMYACILALHLTSHVLVAGTHVVFHTDNECTMHWINGSTAQNQYGNHLQRLLAMMQLMHGFTVEAEHIPGKLNVAADLLSRLETSPNALTQFAALYAPFPLVQIRFPTRTRSCCGWLQPRSFQALSLQVPVGHMPVRAWRQWITFTQKYGCPMYLENLGAGEATQILLQYLAYSAAASNLAHSTVKVRVYAIAWHFKLAGFENPIAGNDPIRMFLRGIKRVKGGSARKAPVTVGMLDAAYRILNHTDPA